MERYTMTDVRAKLVRLVGIAKQAGYETTDWSVNRGTKHYSLTYVTTGGDSRSMDLGGSAREACGRLEAFTTGMLEMAAHRDPGHQAKVMGAALRASAKLEEHRHKCQHCALHLIGAKVTWCDQYKKYLEIWREGIILAHADHSQKYPVGAALSRAISA